MLNEESVVNALCFVGDSIIFHGWIARRFGINEAILLSCLLNRYLIAKRTDELNKGDWFDRTEKDIQHDTALSPFQQRLALTNLKAFISIKKQGVPPKRFYKFNFDAISKILLSNINKPNVKKLSFQTESTSTYRLVPSFPPSSSKKKKKKLLTEDKPRKSKRIMINPIEEKQKENVSRTALPTNEVMEIIFYWNDKKPKLAQLRLPKIEENDNHRPYCINPTKTFLETAVWLKNLLCGNEGLATFRGYTNVSRQFSLWELKRAVDNFHLAVNSPDFEPVSKKGKERLKRISLRDFIYCPFMKNGTFDGKSFFMEYVDSLPKLARHPAQFAKEKHSQTTSILIKTFEEFMGKDGWDGEGEMPENIKARFVYGANRLFDDYQERVKWAREYAKQYGTGMPFVMGTGQRCRLLMKALMDKFPDPGVRNIGSAYTYDVVLPEYFKKHGY